MLTLRRRRRSPLKRKGGRRPLPGTEKDNGPRTIQQTSVSKISGGPRAKTKGPGQWGWALGTEKKKPAGDEGKGVARVIANRRKR